ncbi:MAG: chemotaxis protein CheW [Methanoregula sp.]|jgi:chemotaxis signal transduction protein|nr:chemotaxis protein CheW [Methanoregula sp.]
MTSLLKFSVEGIACAIPNNCTLFVVQMIALILPDVPGGRVSGTANIEGNILPVYSLRRLFGFAERPPRPSDIMIIAQAGPETIALWADETSDVMDSSVFENINTRQDIAGLHISADGVVIIHDLPAFLNCANPDAVRIALPRPNKEVVAEVEDPARVRSILEKRAKKMARPVKVKNEVMPIEVLKFRLANQEYAISMDYIREVILTGEITPVPGTPEYISGICAIRGEIISLVDLREFFKIRGKGLTDLNRVIVISDGKITFGILADFITGLGTILKEMLAPVRMGQTPIAETFLLGAVEDLIILNATALLADPTLVIDDTRT